MTYFVVLLSNIIKCQLNNLCVALAAQLILGEEDCLKLNVYVPEIMDDVLLPVMVYINGGGPMVMLVC